MTRTQSDVISVVIEVMNQIRLENIDSSYTYQIIENVLSELEGLIPEPKFVELTDHIQEIYLLIKNLEEE